MTAGPAHVPLFSIIVPVHDSDSYLSTCLDSILGQPMTDFELITIDDASRDSSGRILDDYAQRDGRMVVVHLGSNVGLGAARNVGIGRARGSYLVFVDSDDIVAAAGLHAIAERIEGSGMPDVVMYGFARSFADGRVVRDLKPSWLAPEDTLRAKDRPELLKIIPSAWNKACRREFILEHGFRFADGLYEDLPWTYPLLMSAQTVTTLQTVCYEYRQHTVGGLLASSGLGHLDLLAQYDRVFEFIDDHPVHEPWRRIIFDRMAWHVPSVLEMTQRIPPADRRTFFHAAREAVLRHHPQGYRPSGRLGLKIWLLERQSYPVFRGAQFANRLRRRVSGPRP